MYDRREKGHLNFATAALRAEAGLENSGLESRRGLRGDLHFAYHDSPPPWSKNSGTIATSCAMTGCHTATILPRGSGTGSERLTFSALFSRWRMSGPDLWRKKKAGVTMFRSLDRKPAPAGVARAGAKKLSWQSPASGRWTWRKRKR